MMLKEGEGKARTLKRRREGNSDEERSKRTRKEEEEKKEEDRLHSIPPLKKKKTKGPLVKERERGSRCRCAESGGKTVDEERKSK
ncbi:hypothetical protein E2C01_085019 [Portunus trituberculatus]|uniref:Uncharacterized protein n=1 Tax=Portunus trituberculatus TaxID=210409 RepID=A0A5B7J1H4_PORTR|nr:hypothetical protein [Portunus trituberculatus]